MEGQERLEFIQKCRAKDMTFAEIGKALKITGARVRQLFNKAERKDLLIARGITFNERGRVVKEIPSKSLSLTDLKRIAIAKHGENRAWSLAILNGNPNRRKSWSEAITTPALSLVEQLEHEIWQENIKENLK